MSILVSYEVSCFGLLIIDIIHSVLKAVSPDSLFYCLSSFHFSTWKISLSCRFRILKASCYWRYSLLVLLAQMFPCTARCHLICYFHSVPLWRGKIDCCMPHEIEYRLLVLLVLEWAQESAPKIAFTCSLPLGVHMLPIFLTQWSELTWVTVLVN